VPWSAFLATQAQAENVAVAATVSTEPFERCGMVQNLRRPLHEALSIIGMAFVASIDRHGD